MDSPDSLPGFYFAVKIAGVEGASDSSFAEVCGIELEYAPVENSEGSENSVPGRGNSGNLVLKRGVMSGDSRLWQWCIGVLDSGLDQALSPQNLELSLLNGSGIALRTWNVSGAWPVKWCVPPLDPGKSEILIETLELAYMQFVCI